MTPSEFALAWSGGKDSLLALDRAERAGLRVPLLFNIFEGSTGRVRFHGVPAGLIAEQAAALGRELVQEHTHPADFERAFSAGLERLRERGIGGILFGNIHLADVRAWYEERTTALGLEHREPLWGEEPAGLVREFLSLGYSTRVVSVHLELGRREWLGRDLDESLAREIRAVPGADPAGERGEFHTFAYDGPLFRRPVAFQARGSFEREGHAVLDVVQGER